MERRSSALFLCLATPHECGLPPHCDGTKSARSRALARERCAPEGSMHDVKKRSKDSESALCINRAHRKAKTWHCVRRHPVSLLIDGDPGVFVLALFCFGEAFFRSFFQ